MYRSLFALLALVFTAVNSTAQPDAALANLTYSGDQQALAELDSQIKSARTDAAKLRVLQSQLLSLLGRADLTFAARQAIAQRLPLVLTAGSGLTEENRRVLATMLADERDADLARLALEPIPGAEVDELITSALAKAGGRARLGLIGTIGVRRTAAAVPALAALLKEPDPATAGAAASALGAIGNSAAAAALRAAPVTPAIAAARLHVAAQLPTAEAVPLLRELQGDRQAPEPIRAAAFRTSLDIEPAQATTRIIDALGGRDARLKQVAIEALASSAAPNLVPALVAKLASWEPTVQAGVLAALARRADPLALPAVTAATSHKNPQVRHAAIAAIGFLPANRETATLLARVVAGPDSDAAKLARQSLTRLNGTDISAAILIGAESAEAALRPAFIEQLALRNMTEGLPALFKMRGDASPAIRAAAVAALGELAPATDEPKLLDWTLTATDPDEQSRALRALVNVSLRNPSVAERGRSIFAALDNASIDAALRLLPALPRLGGAASAGAAARLALRDDPKLAEAATATLGRWTDASALPSLAHVAAKAPVPAARDAARAAVLRYFERNREPWAAENTAAITTLLASSTDAATREQMIGVLRRADDAAALSLAESLQKDAQLGPRAKLAAEVIRANLAGRPKLRGSSNSGLANVFDFNPNTRWSVPTQGQEWLEIDFLQERPLERITLDQTRRADEFPEQFDVYVTNDLKQPGKPVVTGKGQSGKTVIPLPATTRGRYVIIRNTAERKDGNWSVVELFVD